MGLDTSQPMLDLARHKSANLPIQWIQGDIRDFQLKKTFDLIIMVGNSFHAFLSESGQRDMLKCVKQHLKPSGNLPPLLGFEDVFLCFEIGCRVR